MQSIFKLLIKRQFSSSRTSTSKLGNISIHHSTAVPLQYDIVIIGGGIIGLSTARNLLLSNPKLKLSIVEKESTIAAHQSSHNSGVIHAGIYYKPGSQRAELCVSGAAALYQYCNTRKIPIKQVGKLIVATQSTELEQLELLYNRGKLNGVSQLRLLTNTEITAIEPNVTGGIAAIDSPTTGIADFGLVAASYATEIMNELNGKIHYNYELVRVENIPYSNTNNTNNSNNNRNNNDWINLYSSTGKLIQSKYVITCCGLYADRIANLFNKNNNNTNTTNNSNTVNKGPSIVPFRGSWLLMRSEYSNYIRRNIYPVPNPAFPFLGIHLTPQLNSQNILIGPNAVLATDREGYSLNNINLTDLIESIKSPELQLLIRKHWKYALSQFAGELFPITMILKQIQQYTPSITAAHILINRFNRRPITKSGVRAQAIGSNGELIEDFVFDSSQSPAVLHIRNAPSPAATASIVIGKRIAEQAEKQFGLK